MIIRLAAALAAALVSCSAAQAAGPPVVRIDAGQLRGVRDGGVSAFLGVPYAAPPVGDRRWRPPAPAAPWPGVRDATAFAPACPQTGVSMPGETPPRTREDCLYLNVWAPQGARRAPVIVWIHGGGWTNGATAMPLYRGDRFARRGVVLVSLAYRLGPLGWLAHPELSTEGGGASGDYGLMDQIAALQWVRRNIAAFGGDPGNVTIAGQSAGGMSVSLLMASPRAAGLFHRAIAESGGLFEPRQLAASYSLAGAERDGAAYAASVGAASLAELRRLPVERLLGGTAGQISHPTVGTPVLPLSPFEAYAAGRQNDVPVLVGSNAAEGNSLIDLGKVRAATWREDVTRAWGPLPAPLLEAYPFTDDASARRARADFERDLRFGWDMWAWARLQAARSRRPVWYYRFDREPPFPANSERAGWGAGHFAELWYVFDHLDQEPWSWTPADRRLAERMSRYWVNFARSGDPNGAGLPAWPRFTLDAPRLLRLGEDATPAAAPADGSLRTFDAVYDTVRGTPVPSDPR